MLRPVAKSVEAMEDYKIAIEFDSGEKKIFDVSPYITGSWYGELSDVNYFKLVIVKRAQLITAALILIFVSVAITTYFPFAGAYTRYISKYEDNAAGVCHILTRHG